MRVSSGSAPDQLHPQPQPLLRSTWLCCWPCPGSPWLLPLWLSPSRPRAPLRSGYLSVFVTQGLELPSPRPSQPACMREAHTRPTGPSYTSGLGRVPCTRGGQALGPALPVAYPDARPYPGARRHIPSLESGAMRSRLTWMVSVGVLVSYMLRFPFWCFKLLAAMLTSA